MSLSPLPTEARRLAEFTATNIMGYKSSPMGWLEQEKRRGWLLRWGLDVWNPVYEKEQAMMVLEKLSEKWVIFISTPCAVEAGVIYSNGRSETYVEAESASLAICRLALYLDRVPLEAP